MKEIFWNSRGLCDLAKFKFLSDTSKEQNLDFIALLETCRTTITDSELNNLCGGKQFLWSAGMLNELKILTTSTY